MVLSESPGRRTARTEQFRPLVSVITTVYNAEHFVERCIDSVLAQTYANWEQIIVDDGSSDRTAELVERYRDPRIRFIRLAHRGIGALAESYNAALAQARGDLVAVLEGDDYWPAEKLARQVPSFADENTQLCWGNAIVVDREGHGRWRWPGARLPRELSLERVFQRLTRANVLTPTVTVMVRRSALTAVGGFQQPAGVLFVDLPTWLKISALVRGKAVKLDEMLGYYRVYDAQISSQYYQDYHRSQMKVVDAILADCDPNILARIGWSSRQREISVAAAALDEGIATLANGERRAARQHLLNAIRFDMAPRAIVRGVLGLASTFLPWNLVATADSIRRLALGKSGRM